MNIQEENSARYFRVQSEREQTLVNEEKKDVRMLNTSLKSTETSDELSVSLYLHISVLSGCLSMPDATC